MENTEIKIKKDPVGALSSLIDRLRGENGCPWDRKQTPDSMSVYLIEEVFELVDAIATGNAEAVCEELGDVLFQILFVIQMYQTAGAFGLHEVVEKNLEKMIRRHPHVFGHQRADTAEQVRESWNRTKMKEKENGTGAGLLDSVPSKLPALLRAYRISERAAGAGFDWADLNGVVEKTEEEWQEFKTAVRQGKPGEVALEFGDILFTLVNVARFAKIHPETALAGSTRKFEKRFRQMETHLARSGRTIDTVSRDELDRLWESVKAELDS